MIYAINIPEVKDLSKCLELFKKNGGFIYTDKMVYIKTSSSLDVLKKAIRELLGLDSMFIIFEINSVNMYRQSSNALNWIQQIKKEELIREEKANFEKQNQESLAVYSNMLDYLEDDLNKKLSEKTQGKE